MTREMGSRGKDIAIGLASRLQLPIVHHNLVERDVSQRMHVSESDVHRHLEGKTSLLERWRFPRKKLTSMTACEVLELAEEGNVIIRGWGSTQLLRSVGHVLCVRVRAPMAQRIETLMERLETTDKAYVRKEIIINDTAHAQILKRMLHGNWQDPKHFDLVINTERVPVDEGVDLIEHALQLPSFQETDASRATLKMLRIKHQIQTMMLTDPYFKSKSALLEYEVDEKTHDVVIRGGVRQETARQRIIDKVKSVKGVGKVVDNLAPMWD